MIIITLGIITKGMGGDFKRFAGLGLEGTGRLWINTWGQHTPTGIATINKQAKYLHYKNNKWYKNRNST